MSRLQLFCLVVAVYVSVSQRVTADQDLIGPIVAVQGQPIDLFFSNRVLPQPSVKVLQFVGEAINHGSTVAQLGIHFDYTDAAGNTVIVPLPNFYQRAVPPGLHAIDAGPTTLPFCPEQVSIHFELLTPGEVQISGTFDHTCVPIPEPGAGVLLGLGSLIGCTARRRFVVYACPA